MSLARAHRAVGLLTLAAFIASGVYLRVALPAPDDSNLWLHLASRSNHIYLLMAGLLNLTLGLYVSPAARPRVQAIGSALLLAAPAVLGAAFLREPSTGSLSRPLTRAGVVMVAVGIVLHAVSRAKRRRAAA